MIPHVAEIFRQGDTCWTGNTGLTGIRVQEHRVKINCCAEGNYNSEKTNKVDKFESAITTTLETQLQKSRSALCERGGGGGGGGGKPGSSDHETRVTHSSSPSAYYVIPV